MTTVAPIRVLLADDHPLVRAGLRTTLGSHGDMMLVGEVGDGDAVQRLCHTQRPDVLLLDVRMPGATVLATVRQLRTDLPTVRVIIVTAYDDPGYAQQLLDAGARGYVLKDELPERVVDAIQTVAGGGTWISPALLATLRIWSAHTTMEPRRVALTEREAAVVQHVAQGQTNDQIGVALGISERTVRFHLGNVFDKLGVRTRADVIAWAVRAERNVAMPEGPLPAPDASWRIETTNAGTRDGRPM